MSETQDQKSFFKRHWEGYKEFWAERFSFLENYSRVLNPEKPMPHWDSSIVEEFIASDPVYGPTLKTSREAAQFGAAGAVLGAVTTAGYCWKYSRSAHGAALAFGFGAVTDEILPVAAKQSLRDHAKNQAVNFSLLFPCATILRNDGWHYV
ncbi:unnamed protein product [Fraxinus pennsylvanica]|uniref:Succinate dehydrogenase subunit 6, mitochondrial n=1 Tax=Fraxinus pennsylvanica TaxID=56036 RepID=A0AAD2E5S8_9LAMI|nr:unnamed protein product [Fraxinus pennsylvanica]